VVFEVTAGDARAGDSAAGSAHQFEKSTFFVPR